MGNEMREFWDARARENPFYYVDSRVGFGDPNVDRFWQGGERPSTSSSAARRRGRADRLRGGLAALSARSPR
jgi:hypothetical protein